MIYSKQKITGLVLAAMLATFQVGADEEAEVHWGYEGEAGPEHWADLKRDFALCEFGVHQSPINLTGADELRYAEMEKFVGDIQVDVGTRAQVMELLDNGHSIQVTSNADVGMEMDGDRYQLLQFHFHSPSEHTIEGRRYPLEAHFVMGSEDGRLVVMGFLYEEGEKNADFDVIIDALPDHEGETRYLEDLDFNVDDMKPLPASFYAYSGSLTTPPCSEGVRWLVAAEPETMAADQIEALTSVLHGNARPLQPRHVRPLYLVTQEE